MVAVILLVRVGRAGPKGAEQNPLAVDMIAVPRAINGEAITAATLSNSGLLALGTAGGHLVIVDSDLKPWRGWKRSLPTRDLGRSADPSGDQAIVALAFAPDEVAIAGVTNNRLIVWRVGDTGYSTMPVNGDVTAMALSTGGHFVAMAKFDIVVIDAARLRIMQELQQPTDVGGNGTYTAVAFTPDIKTLVAAADSTVDTWDLPSGKNARHLSCRCVAEHAAFSANGSLAVFGTGDAHALLWDVAAGGVAKEKTISTVKGDHVYGVATSLNGSLVAAGTASGALAVWDTDTDVIKARAQPSERPITEITSDRDGKMLLVGIQSEPYVRGSPDRLLVTVRDRSVMGR
jgi:WD40 repeat protein